MGCCCSKKSTLDQETLDESTTIYSEHTYRPPDISVKETTKNVLNDVSKKRPLVRRWKAIKIQSVWRGYCCRRDYLKKRNGIILIQSGIRRILARKTAILALKEDLLHNIVISLDSASDVQDSSNSSIDIYAVVTGYNHETHRNHFHHHHDTSSGETKSDESTRNTSSDMDSIVKKTVGPESRRMNLVSYNKSNQFSKGSKFHFWGEKIFLTGLRFDADVVITLFEHHKIITDRLIGQVRIVFPFISAN